mgnify:CR=1 FL=1
MLTAEDNDLLCRVEGDAPMGQLVRRHWIPACLSEEVAEPDGAPVKVRLLGEDRYNDLMGGTEKDLGYQVEGMGRFRVNLFLAQGEVRGVMRHSRFSRRPLTSR